MAKSSFLTLCRTARKECRITGLSGPAAVTEQAGLLGEIVRWVADADQEAQGLWFDWAFLKLTTWSSQTVANTAAVAAPTDLGVWDRKSFWLDRTLSTNKPLTVMDYDAWRRDLDFGVRVSKKPDSVVILPDQSLKLEPPPDGIYTLTGDYWKRPAKMAANGDTSPIPEEYERIIIARVKIFYGEREGVGEILASGQAEYDSLLDMLEAKYLPYQEARRRAAPDEQMVVRVE